MKLSSILACLTFVSFSAFGSLIGCTDLSSDSVGVGGGDGGTGGSQQVCEENTPLGGYSCQDLVAKVGCSDASLAGYCNITCGRCLPPETSSSSGSGGSGGTGIVVAEEYPVKVTVWTEPPAVIEMLLPGFPNEVWPPLQGFGKVEEIGKFSSMQTRAYITVYNQQMITLHVSVEGGKRSGMWTMDLGRQEDQLIVRPTSGFSPMAYAVGGAGIAHDNDYNCDDHDYGQVYKVWGTCHKAADGIYDLSYALYPNENFGVHEVSFDVFPE